MCVLVFVPLGKTRVPVDWRVLVKDNFDKVFILLDVFCFCCLNDFWQFDFFLFLFFYLQPGLLCLMGELAGGGSVAVAVSVCDK